MASNRHIHYNKSIEKIEALEKTGNLYAIRPEHALEVGRLEKDPEKFEAIYQEGLEQMRNDMTISKYFLEITKKRAFLGARSFSYSFVELDDVL